MDKPVGVSHTSPFERIKKANEEGMEFWLARDLMKILEYANYRNFKPVIEKAKISCENSGQDIDSHFAEVRTMGEIGLGKKIELEDYALSRYACYLIIQNADPIKPMVALGQTYFAVQTRKQEIFEQSSEEEKRIMLREELRKHNAF